jgi:hypothetical protein
LELLPIREEGTPVAGQRPGVAELRCQPGVGGELGDGLHLGLVPDLEDLPRGGGFRGQKGDLLVDGSLHLGGRVRGARGGLDQEQPGVLEKPGTRGDARRQTPLLDQAFV